MPTFKSQFFSTVFIGKQNPRILNHDFLDRYDIIPRDKEPFRTLFSKKDTPPFSDFISTPVLATIKYDNIQFVVEDNKFQIIDNKFNDPTKSLIIPIAKKYFGERLCYTPLKKGGVNFNGIIEFESKQDEELFDREVGISREDLIKKIGEERLTIGMTFSFPWKDGVVQIQMPKPKEGNKICAINFNYEFKFNKDMERFLNNLDNVDNAFKKFNDFLTSLNLRDVK